MPPGSHATNGVGAGGIWNLCEVWWVGGRCVNTWKSAPSAR